MVEYTTRGAVPLGSQAYVTRPFEERLLSKLLSRNWVLFLGPRQHGKTSAIIRLEQALREAGVRCVRLDLQAMPVPASYEDFLSWLATTVSRKSGVVIPSGASGGGDLIEWLRISLPQDSLPVVILVDEASAIGDPALRNAFYGQLRAIANEAASAGPQSLEGRLTFLFAGTFRPETLVDPLNSPFNVCDRVEPEDLTADQVRHLAALGSHQDAERVGTAVYEAVGGQPYLAQALLSAVCAPSVDEDSQDEALAQALSELAHGADPHFDSVFGPVVGSAELMDAALASASPTGTLAEAANHSQKYLQVLGVTKRVSDRAHIRNALYRDFVTSSPQFQSSGGATTAMHGLLPLPEDQFDHMSSPELCALAVSAYNGGIGAYRAGSHRMALVAFGASLESLLVDLFGDAARLQSAVAAARAAQGGLHLTRFEDETDAKTLRLATLVRLAQTVVGLESIAKLSDAVRDYRNQVHPSVALADFKSEADLEPEARLCSGVICALLRDIRGLAP